jgi:hypothetical protein
MQGKDAAGQKSQPAEADGTHLHSLDSHKHRTPPLNREATQLYHEMKKICKGRKKTFLRLPDKTGKGGYNSYSVVKLFRGF